MADTYRAAIIGTGGIANAHAGYYVNDERTEIVAGADINEEHLTEFCDKYEIPDRYLDYEEMLAEQQPDLVSVCTWNATHPEITIAAAQAGVKAIISEKPMGEDLGGPMDAVTECERRGVKLVVHHQTRFKPGLRAVRELIAEGAIGTPVLMHYSTGGGILNIGSHSIDNYRWMIGDPAWTGVAGWIQRNTDRYERGAYCEEKTHALIEFDGGSEMILSIDMVDRQKATQFRIFGPEGVINFDREWATVTNGEGTREVEMQPQPTYLGELIEWIEGGPEHRNAGRIALVSQQIMMAIYESAKTRTRVEMPYDKRESPLAQMIEGGTLPAEGEPYDIRLEEALAYAEMRRRQE